MRDKKELREDWGGKVRLECVDIVDYEMRDRNIRLKETRKGELVAIYMCRIGYMGLFD